MKTIIMQKKENKYGLATLSFADTVHDVVDVAVQVNMQTEHIDILVTFKEPEMDNLMLRFEGNTGNKSFLIGCEALTGINFTGPKKETVWALAQNEVCCELLERKRMPSDAQRDKLINERVTAKLKEAEPTFEMLCEKLKAVDDAGGWAKQVMTRYDLTCAMVFISKIRETKSRW